MPTPEEVHGHGIAMIAWGTDEHGEDEAVVYAGQAQWDGSVLTVVRRPPDASFELEPEWLGRIQPVSDHLRETLLGATYSFSVTVGPLPEDAPAEEYRMLGIRWIPHDAS